MIAKLVYQLYDNGQPMPYINFPHRDSGCDGFSFRLSCRMSLKLVKPKETPSERVRRYLEDALASGRFAQGSKLPTERAISIDLEVPRNAVREALAVLEMQRKVVRAVGSGTFVGEVGDAPPAAAPEFEALGALRDASPKEIMEARYVLEPRLALLVVDNATAADFAGLEDLLREGDNADTFSSFDAADDAFHQAIAEATHSRLVIELYAAIGAARRRAAWGVLRRKFLTSERRVASRREHRAIVRALKTRDAKEAETAVLNHLRAVDMALLDGRGDVKPTGPVRKRSK
jgi:DNA-binding FadR family transcriptional regulator